MLESYIFDKKAETMSRDEIHAVQTEGLKKCVRRVYDNVPFYRAKMDALGVRPDDIRDADDIVKLPFTEKQDLRDNYPYGLFAAPMKEITRIHASSGTTGKPTVAGYTKNDLDIWAELVARCLAAAGVTDKDIVHVAYGYGLFTGGLGAHCGAEAIGATMSPIRAIIPPDLLFTPFGKGFAARYSFTLLETPAVSSLTSEAETVIVLARSEWLICEIDFSTGALGEEVKVFVNGDISYSSNSATISIEYRRY